MRNNSSIIVRNVRFVFVHVFEKDELMQKYSARILVPKNSPQVQDLIEAFQAAVAIGADRLKGYQPAWSETIHDGDTKFDKEGKPVHPGHYYLNAKSNSKPGIVKVNKSGMGSKTMEITDPDEFYSGCYGCADIAFFAFNQGVNRGVSVALNNVLKVGGEDGEGNGPRIGGGRQNAESVFGAYIEEGEDFPE